jgi:hypothetical protein
MDTRQSRIVVSLELSGKLIYAARFVNFLNPPVTLPLR